MSQSACRAVDAGGPIDVVCALYLCCLFQGSLNENDQGSVVSVSFGNILIDVFQFVGKFDIN